MKIFLKSTLALLIIFGTILGYVHEVPYFSNTFDIRYLFFRFLLLGGVVGLVMGWFIMKRLTDSSDRMPLMLLSVVIGLAIFPLFGIATNHILAKKTPLSMKAVFQKEEPLRTSRFGISKNNVLTADAFYVYFTKDFKTDRIRSSIQSFKQVAAGQEIELPIKNGFWGFDFVDLR